MNKQESPLSEVPEVPASINAESEKQRREIRHERLLQSYEPYSDLPEKREKALTALQNLRSIDNKPASDTAFEDVTEQWSNNKVKRALQGAIEQGDPAALAYIRVMAEVQAAIDIYTDRLAQLMREETNEDTLYAHIEVDPQLLQQKTRIEGLRERERAAAAFQSWATQGESQPKPLARQIESAIEFSFHTSQEMHAFNCAQADGKTGNGYQRNVQAGAIVYQRAGLLHLIRMELTEGERTAGLALDYLEGLARAQDADAVLATAYILGVLAPPPHLPARPYAGGWIDFDDVLKKIGAIPRNAKDRREWHAKVWSFVKFGERAQIIGRRTGKYQIDGETIDTTIHGAAWRVMKTETPDPPALYSALETPVRAEIVISKELTALITNPKAAQYFQCGEVLGAIPSGKPAGAWARVIGLALLSFWRRKPREHDAGTLKPTRRELLNHYAAKIAPYEEILESANPARVIEYWCGALQILADEGFIERTGEAAITAKAMRAGLPRQNWQDLWLDQSVIIEIGAKTKPAFEKVLKALPELKTRDLKKKPRAKKRP